MCAKQTIAKAWRTPYLSVTEMKNRVTQAMFNVKREAVYLDTIRKYEKLWYPCVTHFLPPNLMNSPGLCALLPYPIPPPSSSLHSLPLFSSLFLPHLPL